MKIEFNFLLYIFIYVSIGFIDFFFHTNGIATLIFDLLVIVIIILVKKEKISLQYVNHLKNIYALCLLLFLQVSINLLFSNNK